jgi:ribonuclease HII
VKTGLLEIDGTTADYIVGSDECGYGCWAGPLVVCAVVVPRQWPLASEVKDSKALSHERRVAIATKIIKGLVYCVVSVTVDEIDSTGVYKSLLGAHARAIRGVIKKHEDLGVRGTNCIVVDGNMVIDVPGAISLPKADALVPAVSAASILGKVARDDHMTKQAKLYPGYGFEEHKGYGTPKHQEALKRLGHCAIHRKSYAPIATIIREREAVRQDQLPWEMFDSE